MPGYRNTVSHPVSLSAAAGMEKEYRDLDWWLKQQAKKRTSVLKELMFAKKYAAELSEKQVQFQNMLKTLKVHLEDTPIA